MSPDQAHAARSRSVHGSGGRCHGLANLRLGCTVGCTPEPTVLRIVTAVISRLRITCADTVSRALGYACVPRISCAAACSCSSPVLLAAALLLASAKIIVQRGGRSLVCKEPDSGYIG